MNRRTIALRQFVAASLALFAALAIITHAAGCKGLTASEQAKVAEDSVKLGSCFATSHLCKVAAKALNPDAGSFPECWAEFDACMVAHGYMDGGK